MNISDFKHKIVVHVRFNEVDMLGVCHNAAYINFFEEGRLQYIKELGLIPKNGLFSDEKLFFIVRNEIDYKSHSRYNDELNVYSRISFIKNSSFGFEHIIHNATSGEIVVEGAGVVVQVDPVTRKSLPLGDDFINRVQSLQPNVKILKDK